MKMNITTGFGLEHAQKNGNIVSVELTEKQAVELVNKATITYVNKKVPSEFINKTNLVKKVKVAPGVYNYEGDFDLVEINPVNHDDFTLCLEKQGRKGTVGNEYNPRFYLLKSCSENKAVNITKIAPEANINKTKSNKIYYTNALSPRMMNATNFGFIEINENEFNKIHAKAENYHGHEEGVERKNLHANNGDVVIFDYHGNYYMAIAGALKTSTKEAKKASLLN